jgi:hypothetical protein
MLVEAWKEIIYFNDGLMARRTERYKRAVEDKTSGIVKDDRIGF